VAKTTYLERCKIREPTSNQMQKVAKSVPAVDVVGSPFCRRFAASLASRIVDGLEAASALETGGRDQPRLHCRHATAA
jgi:hypothetical protein